ncbi:hypothetical protein J6590_089758, partial [Homalodisca vitripennis]
LQVPGSQYPDNAIPRSQRTQSHCAIVLVLLSHNICNVEQVSTNDSRNLRVGFLVPNPYS